MSVSNMSVVSQVLWDQILLINCKKLEPAIPGILLFWPMVLKHAKFEIVSSLFLASLLDGPLLISRISRNVCWERVKYFGLIFRSNISTFSYE